MADKNLPIKFFQKREVDEQDQEGAGGGNPPKWLLPEPLLRERSSYYREVLSGIGIGIRIKVQQNNYIPTVVKVRMNGDAVAKSYRWDIIRLFNTGKFNLIGFSGEEELLVKIESIDDLALIERQFGDVVRNSIGISAIDDLEPFSVEMDDDLTSKSILKVKLFNFQDLDLNKILLRSFERFCHERQFEFKQARYGDGQHIYRLQKVTVDGLEELKNFDGIFTVTEMPEFKSEDVKTSVENTIEIRTPQAGKEYPVVGVLDSGISKTSHLSPWIDDRKITYHPEDYVNQSHGTFVAGVLLYGDQLEGQVLTGANGCKLVDAVVFPDLSKGSILEDDLVANIEDAISRNSDIKIWNLSLGTSKQCDLNQFSDFAVTLDQIQEKYNVLICKSAGNCENFKFGAPRSRISKSAETVRSLVVGSLAQSKGKFDLSEVMHPSPFTRFGPGPAYLIKPDVVHFGGNAGLDSRNNAVYNGVKSFGIDGSLATNVGTSFATPRVTALVAELSNQINETFNPLLIKALVIHSSRHPNELEVDIADKIKMTGFGMPPNVEEIIFNDPDEITLILQDTLEKGAFINIMDFPFPQSLINDEGFYEGEVTVTLVTSPILDDTQGVEYCQSDLDIKLGTYDEKKDRDITKKHIKNPVGVEGNMNLLNEGIYSKRTMRKMDNEFSKERVLLKYKNKFQPVKKWVLDLSELTEGSKENYLKAPKQWYMKIIGLFRFYTEKKFEAVNKVPSQEFCLLVTIRDKRKRGTVYNEVTQLLENFGFIHNNIKVKEEVRIRTKG
ncbi:S8 family peptidase [Algoriphagus sp.]|uniref:S8 family peptidase n=1 Tax=Algoriphagus sp. TaxID=1872435 RepID=UPI003F70CBF2